MTTSNGWQQKGDDWWLYDITQIEGATQFHDRALFGYWQAAPYEAREFSGRILFANPSQNTPEIRIPLPASGRISIAVGMLHNYSDRLLLKIEGEQCFSHLQHSPTPPESQVIEECWWRDVDVEEGDVLILKQDNAMKRRCNVALIHLYPAPPPTQSEIPILVTADGMPGNDGPIDLDEMLANELQFADTHISAILHGTDMSGAAQYSTQLPSHRLPIEEIAKEATAHDEYYAWTVEQMLKYEKEGRCPLRDSIEATHSIGRKLYAYHRMAITRVYAPMRVLFFCPFYDAHPEWRCEDFDGTPISRLSVAYPEVREYFLEHFRENIEFGADGLCLVFSRGWPLVLFEKPVADEFQKRTGRAMSTAAPDDEELRQVRADFVTDFVREIQQTMKDAARGRETKIISMTLATPAINRFYGMDCDAWVREGLVQTLVPYPYGYEAKTSPIKVEEWLPIVKGTETKLCPTLNRMTYEPEGIFETPLGMLDRAEEWLELGVDGFSFWDMDSALALPTFRGLAYNLGSKEGRARFRRTAERGAIEYELKTLDGLAVDRYHPGWNV